MHNYLSRYNCQYTLANSNHLFATSLRRKGPGRRGSMWCILGDSQSEVREAGKRYIKITNEVPVLSKPVQFLVTNILFTYTRHVTSIATVRAHTHHIYLYLYLSLSVSISISIYICEHLQIVCLYPSKTNKLSFKHFMCLDRENSYRPGGLGL